MRETPRERRARRFSRLAWLLVFPLFSACTRQASEQGPSARASAALIAQAPGSPSSAATAAGSTPKARAAKPAAAPTLLLSLSSSAYNASVAVDDDAVYVLTSDAAYRIVPGKPPERSALDLSYGATLTRHFVLFWSKGAIYKAAKLGGKPSKVATLPHQPQYFVSSGDAFAWLDNAEDGRFSIQSLDGAKPRTVYAATGKIDAMAMLQDWVFFVERVGDSAWRLGRVRAAGGSAEFTLTKPGRSPSMLAASRDLYYYDGNTLEVRVLSPDFQREQVLAKDFICSPIAVWDRVYCGQVQGLFELPGSAQGPERLTDNGHRSTTAIAANETRIAWLSDTGPDQLAVSMLPLGSGR